MRSGGVQQGAEERCNGYGGGVLRLFFCSFFCGCACVMHDSFSLRFGI